MKELFIRKKDGSNERVINKLGFEITEKILINLNNLIKMKVQN